MHTGQLTEFDLAPRPGADQTASALPVASAVALALMAQIRELAGWADPAELDYIAWRLGQLTNDVTHAALRAADRQAVAHKTGW